MTEAATEQTRSKVERSASPAEADISNPGYQAFLALRIGFTVAPILAGLDKFFYILVEWPIYLPSVARNFLGGNAEAIMMGVGVVEIIAGIGVFVKPKIFGYVVCAWLLVIIANLLMVPGYFDIALRDLGLAIGAFALARLAAEYEA